MVGAPPRHWNDLPKEMRLAKETPNPTPKTDVTKAICYFCCRYCGIKPAWSHHPTTKFPIFFINVYIFQTKLSITSYWKAVACVTRIKLTLLGPCVRAARGARAKATLVSVVLREWSSPRGSVAMVRSTPGARGRQSREARGGRSAQAHTHARTRTRTGTMEKRTPLGRIFPSNGTRVFTSLLILNGLCRECIRLFVLFYLCTFPPFFVFRLPKEVVAEPLGVSLSPPPRHRAARRAGCAELGRVPFGAS